MRLRVAVLLVLATFGVAGCVTRTPMTPRSPAAEPSLASALPAISDAPSASAGALILPSATAGMSGGGPTPIPGPVTTTGGTAGSAVRTPTPPPVPDAAKLRTALLGPGDLAGFTAAQGGAVDGGGGCPPLDSDYTAGASATATVLLSGGDKFVRERLNQLSESAADAAVRRIRGAASCGTYTAEVSGLGTVDVTVTGLGAPALGDGNAAVRITMRPRKIGVVVYENVVAVRRGGTLILLTHTSIGSIDDSLTSTAIGRAYDKTRQLW